MKEKLLIMVLAVVFAACSHRQDGDTTTATSAQYEALRRDVAAMLSDEPDSVFAMLDRLEISDQYPYCVVNLIRGNMYGQMMSLRFAEFYLREAIGEELHEEWPQGYYMGIYNLGLSLQERSNLDEGDKTMQRCYDQLMARATTDTTHASIEQIGTMSTNIALDYYNHYPEATMPWIERAEKALDLLAEHNERSQQPSNEPIMRVKLQMIKAILYATNGQTELATKTYNKVMASSYANHPILISDKMAYLEKTGQWDAAADLVPQFADLNGAEPNDDLTMLCLRIS